MAADGNDVFPIPLAKFVATLESHDEVWSKLLHQRHVRENHTPEEWRQILESYRHKPAHQSA